VHGFINKSRTRFTFSTVHERKRLFPLVSSVKFCWDFLRESSDGIQIFRWASMKLLFTLLSPVNASFRVTFCNPLNLHLSLQWNVINSNGKRVLKNSDFICPILQRRPLNHTHLSATLVCHTWWISPVHFQRNKCSLCLQRQIIQTYRAFQVALTS